MNMIHNGYINNFRQYTFDEINSTLKCRYDGIVEITNDKLDEDIKSGIFYYVYPYSLDIIRREFYSLNSVKRLYYISYSNNKYYYIEISFHFARYSSHMSELNKDVREVENDVFPHDPVVLKIKEYKIWKDLYNDLLCDQMIKLLKSNGYNVYNTRTHKGNQFTKGYNHKGTQY